MNAACFKCACGMCECASDFAEDTCVELVTGCWVSSGQHVNLTALRKRMFGGKGGSLVTASVTDERPFHGPPSNTFLSTVISSCNQKPDFVNAHVCL